MQRGTRTVTSIGTAGRHSATVDSVDAVSGRPRVAPCGGGVDNASALRRQLLAELRHLRPPHIVTQRQVADALDWSPSKVTRIENGSVSLSVTDLRALLAYYGVTDPEVVDGLVDLARRSRRARSPVRRVRRRVLPGRAAVLRLRALRHVDRIDRAAGRAGAAADGGLRPRRDGRARRRRREGGAVRQLPPGAPAGAGPAGPADAVVHRRRVRAAAGDRWPGGDAGAAGASAGGRGAAARRDPRSSRWRSASTSACAGRSSCCASPARTTRTSSTSSSAAATPSSRTSWR